MLIAQITDLHLGFDPDNPDEDNRHRLDSVIARLIDGPNRPDLLLATGDLVDRGDIDSYRRVAAALSRCPFPVHYMLGNHDDRANFARVFPDTPMPDGFVAILPGPKRPAARRPRYAGTRAAWRRLLRDARRVAVGPAGGRIGDADRHRHAPSPVRGGDRVDEHRSRRSLGDAVRGRGGGARSGRRDLVRAYPPGDRRRRGGVRR